MRRPALLLVVPITIMSASAACADRLGQAPDDGPSVWRVFGAFLLCILFALAGALLLRARSSLGALSWTRPVAMRRLRLVESVRLSPQVQLSIVVCDGREMLFTTSPTGAALVRDMDMRVSAETTA